MFTFPRHAAPVVLSLALLACDNKPDPPAAATGPAVATTVNAPALALVGPAAGVQTYPIDPSTAKIEWTGVKITGKHDGSFTKFAGAIDVPRGNAEAGRVRLVIETASLTTDPEKLVGHLKSPDFFDVQRFPTATFESTSIAARAGANGATHAVTGNLTLHGQTRSITFPATISVGGGRIRAKSEFSIARKQFGLVYPGMPDDLIKDDVSIRLTIDAANKS
jgi:polyisoprenoid-binding protein YceI